MFCKRREQLDFNNVSEATQLDAKAFKLKDDMILQARWEGTFHQLFALHDFPFDVQGLKISMAVNCRTNGMTPVKLTLARDVHASVFSEGFAQHYEWDLDERVKLHSTFVSTGAGRNFPTLEVRMRCERMPQFVLVNVACPMCVLSALTGIGYTIDVVEWGLHGEVHSIATRRRC